MKLLNQWGMHELLKGWKKRPGEEGLLHYSSGPKSPGPRAQLLALTPTGFSHYVNSERFKHAVLAASKQGSHPRHPLPVSCCEPVRS